MRSHMMRKVIYYRNSDTGPVQSSARGIILCIDQIPISWLPIRLLPMSICDDAITDSIIPH